MTVQVATPAAAPADQHITQASVPARRWELLAEASLTSHATAGPHRDCPRCQAADLATR